MKIAITFIILLTTLFPSIVHSGEIFGCIKLEKKLGNKLKKEFIGKVVTIRIKPEIGTGTAYKTDTGEFDADTVYETDEYGVYSIYIERKGLHYINMKYIRDNATHTVYIPTKDKDGKYMEDVAVYLSEESVQYDFIIYKENGLYFTRVNNYGIQRNK